MGALLPLVGKAPAVAKPAEKAVLGSSLETFLITSILDTICFPLGGFSEAEQQREILPPNIYSPVKWWGLGALTPYSSMGSHSSHLRPRLSSCFRVKRRLERNMMHSLVTFIVESPILKLFTDCYLWSSTINTLQVQYISLFRATGKACYKYFANPFNYLRGGQEQSNNCKDRDT